VLGGVVVHVALWQSRGWVVRVAAGKQIWGFSRGAVGGGVAVVVRSPGVGVCGILRREGLERRWCVAGFLM
jgi:hypothetical protein